MRVVASALVAIVAALALAHVASAQPDQTSPFPSPSPEATAAPGAGGYAVFGIAALSAVGGLIPASSPSPAVPFSAARASGYSIEVTARLSPSYIGTVRFDETNVHGDDSPVVTRFDASLLYNFGGKQTAAGVGYGSFQRSTLPASANGFGAGILLLPDFTRRTSPYGSAFYYPSLPAPAGTHAGLSVIRLGIAFSPPGGSGLFARLGFSSQHFGAPAFSPTSQSGVELGIGARF